MYNVPDDEPVVAAFELSVPDVVPNKNAVVAAALEPINVDEPAPPFPTVPLVPAKPAPPAPPPPPPGPSESALPVPPALPNPALLPD